MSGLRITVRCDCGQVRYLGYGDSWTCEACGKRWSTAQIPREEYELVARELARYRTAAVVALGVVAAVLVPLGIFVNVVFLFLAPGFLALWAGIVSPFLKRRLGRRVGALPTWQLRPD
jgi:hypothetical protein